MRIAVRKEPAPGERRVAIVPESVKRLSAKKIEVSVETNAGTGSGATDDEYSAAGARVDKSFEAVLANADALVQIRPPTNEDIRKLKEGATLISLLYPLGSPELVRALAARKVTAIAADMIPRTTLAQMMDVLSSQATAAGY
jgi:H+-translocating NAD(P) transhydrogenase subunit alpha